MKRGKRLLTLGASAAGTIAAPAMAQTEWNWAGEGADANWSTQLNWDEGTDPNNGYPIYFTVPTTGYNYCIYDDSTWDDETGIPGSFDEFGIVSITGTSPTLFTLRISGEPFSPDGLKLYDYSKLDVDDDFSTGFTEIHGDAKVDVASSQTRDLEDVTAKSDGITWDAVTATGTYIQLASLLISSEAEGAHINLKLTGAGDVRVINGGSDEGRTTVHGVRASNETAYPAAFWVANAIFSTDTLQLVGGDSFDRRVSLDIDQNVTVDTSTTVGYQSEDLQIYYPGGIVNVDVADGKTLSAGDEMIVYGPTGLKVAGSTGRLETTGQ